MDSASPQKLDGLLIFLCILFTSVFLIGMQLTYNIILVSHVQHKDSMFVHNAK